MIRRRGGFKSRDETTGQAAQRDVRLDGSRVSCIGAGGECDVGYVCSMYDNKLRGQRAQAWCSWSRGGSGEGLCRQTDVEQSCLGGVPRRDDQGDEAGSKVSERVAQLSYAKKLAQRTCSGKRGWCEGEVEGCVCAAKARVRVAAFRDLGSPSHSSHRGG